MTNTCDERPNRRTVLRALGAGATMALLGEPLAGAQGRASIRTLQGDLDPASLKGAVLFHEHLSMRYPIGATEHFTDDVALMSEEARAAKGDGVACVVDGGHADMGRNLDALRRIAADSGLPIVASGGFYMQRSYPQPLASQSADDLAELLIREAREQRYGAFGEIGQQSGDMTADERKVFQAVAMAQSRTGTPISGPGLARTPFPAIRRFVSSMCSRGRGRRQCTSRSATSAA